MELEDVADELYEVPPEEFIAVRTERQNEAKADGDPALAKAIGALPKPALAAWVCNVLVRAHRDEIVGLVELGDLLRSAQENLAGDQLRTLNTQRGQLLNALTRRASAVARERGHPVSTSVAGQVEETLRAAMTDPEAGEALLSGRLTSPMSYSGMGTTSGRPDLRLVVPPKPEKPATRTTPQPPKKTPARTEARESAADRREREREERRRAAEEKHRREIARAREVAEEAAATAAEARAAADEQRRQADELAVEHADLQARVEELADQLAEAERAAGEAAAALKRAQRRRGAAEREAEEAADAAERAAAHVAQLESAGPG